MKTTAADLAAWAADQPPDMVIANEHPHGNDPLGQGKEGATTPDQAARESVGYIANRVRLRLEAATAEWRDSIGGPSDRRLAAWKRLCEERDAFEDESSSA